MREQILAALIAAGYAEDAYNWGNPENPNNWRTEDNNGLYFDPELYTPLEYATRMAKTIEHLFGPTIRLITSATLHDLPQGKFEFQLQDNLKLTGHFRVTDASKIPLKPNPTQEAMSDALKTWAKEQPKQ